MDADQNKIANGFNFVQLSDIIMLIRRYPTYNFADGTFKKDGHALAGYIQDRGVSVEHDPRSGYTSISFYKFDARGWQKLANISADLSGARNIHEVFDCLLRSNIKNGRGDIVSGTDLVNLASVVKEQSGTEADFLYMKPKVFANAKEEEKREKPRERFERAAFEIIPPLESESFRNMEKLERSSFRM